jgi:hypothetical protein
MHHQHLKPYSNTQINEIFNLPMSNDYAQHANNKQAMMFIRNISVSWPKNFSNSLTSR